MIFHDASPGEIIACEIWQPKVKQKHTTKHIDFKHETCSFKWLPSKLLLYHFEIFLGSIEPVLC